MQPRRMQWIKTERREDRRVGPAVGHVRGGKRKRALNMYVSRTCQPRVGSESGLHRLWAPHLPLGKIILDDRNESRRAWLNKFLKSYNQVLS
ncbi:hypothetical protein EV363DRAFT_1279645, partial [Boletus edulis]